MSSSNGIDPFIGCFTRTVFGRKKLLTHIQHVRRLTCCFVGGEARCGYPPGYKTGRAVHSGYAPGMPVPPGDGNPVAGPSRGVMITSRERTYRDKATILDFAQPHWLKSILSSAAAKVSCAPY